MRAVQLRAEQRRLRTQIAWFVRGHASAIVAMAIVVGPQAGGSVPAGDPGGCCGVLGLGVVGAGERISDAERRDADEMRHLMCLRLAVNWTAIEPYERRVLLFADQDHACHQQICGRLIQERVSPEQFLFPAACLEALAAAESSEHPNRAGELLAAAEASWPPSNETML